MTILYIFITIFTFYFLFLSFASLKSSRKVRDKYTSKDFNICVVVYASGEAKTLENNIKYIDLRWEEAYYIKLEGEEN